MEVVKKCRVCKEDKNLDLFEIPYLTRCKGCAAKHASTKIKCEKCNIEISLGYKSKHEKTKKHLAHFMVKQ